MVNKRRRTTSVRRPVQLKEIKRAEFFRKLRVIIFIAAVAAGVLAIIFFGFPLIEDMIKGVDPTLRYQPATQESYVPVEKNPQKSIPEIHEIYLSDKGSTGVSLLMKNDPYIDNERIIFTTKSNNASPSLDTVALYHTNTNQVEILPNTDIKFNNLCGAVLSGDMAAWIDSSDAGGGRIIGYDLNTHEQFLIKEYMYAKPKLSVSGTTLAFMQWAGNTTQRLYVYDLKTREAATVKLYQDAKGAGNSAVDISANDMVWAERSIKNDIMSSVLKRIVFENGVGKFDNYDFGSSVYSPKTNGTDIVYATSDDIISGDLMLSQEGGEPVKIAERVLNFDVGDGFIAYTKEGGIYLYYTDTKESQLITGDITKNLLYCANGTAITFYDITDKAEVLDEVVKYAYID